MSSKLAEMESCRFLVVLSVVLPNAKLVVIAGLYKSVVTNLECLLTVCTMDTWIAVVVCLFGNLWKLECLTTRCDLTLCLFNCSYYLFAGIKRLHARSFRRVQSSTENKFYVHEIQNVSFLSHTHFGNSWYETPQPFWEELFSYCEWKKWIRSNLTIKHSYCESEQTTLRSTNLHTPFIAVLSF